MARVVVVTGRMGAGKSLVLNFFQSMGAPVFQADKAAQRLLEAESPCYGALKDLFGDQFLKPRGGFDRRRLAREVFQNETKRKAMEKIIHPLVHKRFLAFLERERAKGSDLVFYEVPLILKREAFSRFDFVLLVRAPEPLRFKRLMERGLKEEDIRLRERAQIPESEILDQADFEISGAGGRRDLEQRAKEVLEEIQNRSRIDR